MKTLHDLAQVGLIKETEMVDLEKVIETLPFKITDQMQQLIDQTSPNDPIAQQFIPSIEELIKDGNELSDPIGDEKFKKVKGIIHRYPDRCLFMPVHVCALYCRFCFRREKVGAGEETLTPSEMQAAFDYISNHPEIWEVILSGGDPFILKPSMLKKIFHRLEEISHVEIIRVHTRVPFVEPSRINKEFITAIKFKKPMYIVLHVNHPKEFTPQAIAACATLADAGFPLLSQTTLLKNINDNIKSLSTLFRCFLKNRIKPYYLHHPDLVAGTKHFWVSIAKGQQLMRELRGHFSGLCQPTYVLDIPGGFGKVPIGPGYIEEKDGQYSVTDYQGASSPYPLLHDVEEGQ